MSGDYREDFDNERDDFERETEPTYDNDMYNSDSEDYEEPIDETVEPEETDESEYIDEENEKGSDDSKAGETKHAKFVRIAVPRVNKVLEQIRSLGNCSNKSTYDYREDEVEKIFNAIDEELEEAKRKFTQEERKVKRFTL